MKKLRKKPFKVMTRRNDSDFGSNALSHAILKEVLGYFKILEAEPVFVYYSDKDHKWYIIDVFTGLSIFEGKTMRLAEEEFSLSKNLKKYRDFKNTESYHKAILKYQELIEMEGK